MSNDKKNTVPPDPLPPPPPPDRIIKAPQPHEEDLYTESEDRIEGNKLIDDLLK